jgi:hypothetical protein
MSGASKLDSEFKDLTVFSIQNRIIRTSKLEVHNTLLKFSQFYNFFD